ncbi:MAG: alpha/beta fold hydrolase [Planctomycetota bacterium]|nr:MAG: alpha/beta fold hydrolase [Planctomycetota bacterium]
MKKHATPAFLLLGLLSIVVAPACKTPVGVRKTGFEPVYRSYRQNVLDSGEPSASTHEVLAFFGLADRYREESELAAIEFAAVVRREGVRALHVPLAEIHYAIGLRDGDRARFLAAAIHAYFYLFGDGFPDEPNPYSLEFRLACDLYNRGLARAMLTPTGEVTLGSGVAETPAGVVSIETTRPGFPWGEEEFSVFLPADAFEVRGLRERVRTDGLGVPLIAVASGKSAAQLSAEHVGRTIRLPATAFLRLHGGWDELEAGTLRATLELYLGTDVPTVSVGDRTIPLETDVTAPLAYALEGSSIWGFGLAGFLHGRTDDFQSGVFMLQPYQPEKIPLVLIHGTASSPAAWAQTINGILADRRIRARYQVWLAMYNTGNPIAYSAALVRESLRDLVAELDPGGDDPTISEMVLIGHSQGGLVARLLVVSSGTDIWRSISDVPFDETSMSAKNRELLRRCLFFEPLPFVSSVVFISTPHRGSYVAGGWIGRLAKRLVSLPSDLAGAAQDALSGTDLPPALRKIPTSVDNMDPGNNFVKNLAGLPFAEWVRLHSIVSVETRGPVEEGNDGVVEYSSAHLDEAESELVVHHGHSCQGTPETIRELRRILFEHVEVDAMVEEPASTTAGSR